jgi:hypothetical protein
MEQGMTPLQIEAAGWIITTEGDDPSQGYTYKRYRSKVAARIFRVDRRFSDNSFRQIYFYDHREFSSLSLACAAASGLVD